MQTKIDIVANVLGENNIKQLTRSLNGVDAAAAKAQGPLNNTGKAAVAAGKGAKGAAVGVGTLGKAFTAALGPIGAALAGIGGLVAAFQTLSAQDFAEAKFKTLGGDADVLVNSLKQVSVELQGQASVAQLTGAAYDVASAGFTNAADAAEVLKAASLGATGGFSDINTVANAATSVLNAYGMSASEAGNLVDQFVQTQNDGKIVVAEYAREIGKVASVAAGLQVPLSEVNAVIALSTASGVKAEVAFTGLKTALAQLASGDATKRMADLGISIDANTIAADGLVGTFKKIKDSGADMGQVLKLLGTEAGPALAPVLNNLERYEELLRNQEDASGVAARAARTAADTIKGAWTRVQTAVQNIFADQSLLGDLIKGILTGIAVTIEKIGMALQLVMAPLNALKTLFVSMADAAFGIEGTEAIINSFANAWTNVQLAVQEVTQWMQAFATVIGEEIGTKLQPLVQSIGEIIGAIQQKFVEFGEWLTQHFGFIFEGLAKVMELAIGNGSGPLGFLQPIVNGFKAAADGAAGLFEKVKAVKDKLAGAVEEANSQKEALDRSEEVAKKIADHQTKIADGAKAEQESRQRAIDAQGKMLEAQLKLEKQMDTLKKSELQTEIQKLEKIREQAKSREDQAKATQLIYEKQLRIIDIEYNSTIASIEAQRTKLDLQESTLASKISEAEITASIAELEGKNVDAAVAAVNAAKDQLASAKEINQIIAADLEVQRDIAGHIKEQAEAAAKVARDTDMSAIKSGTFAENSSSAAGSLSSAAGSSGTLASNIDSAATSAGNFATSIGNAASAMANVVSGFSQINGASLGLDVPYTGGGVTKTWEGFDSEGAESYAYMRSQKLGKGFKDPRTGEWNYVRDTGGKIFTKAEIQSLNSELVNFKEEYYKKVQQGFDWDKVNNQWIDNRKSTLDKEKAMQEQLAAEKEAEQQKQLEAEEKMRKEKEEARKADEKAAKAALGGATDITTENRKQASLLRQQAHLRQAMGLSYKNLLQEADKIMLNTSSSLRHDTDSLRKNLNQLMETYAAYKDNPNHGLRHLYTKSHVYYGSQKRGGKSGGQAGGFGTPVINFTGSTINFDGDQYLKAADVPALMSTFAEHQNRQTFRNAAYRLRMGV